MTVEAATYLHQLDSTLPQGTESKSEGDNHIRLVKAALKATFPNVAGSVAVTHSEMNLLSGLTGGSIASQLAGKADKAGAVYSGTHDYSGATVTLPASTSIGPVSATELGYIDGVTSPIQPQFTAKASKAGDTYTGSHDFTGANITVPTATAGDSSTKPASTAFVASVAFAATLPGQSGNAGKVVTTNGSSASWSAIKTVNGASLLGAGNVAVVTWTSTTSASANDATDLADATRYSVISGTNRYLPNAPAIGFRVALLDAANLFVGGTWQLKRRNAAHKINNIAQDVTFNFPQGIVTLEYAAANTWVLA